MIVSMENTTTSAIDKKLNQLRDQHGVVTLGRVLTLVILAQAGHSVMTDNPDGFRDAVTAFVLAD